MSLVDLIKANRYKTIFNIIYKLFYKDKSIESVMEADHGFYDAWNNILKIQKPKKIQNKTIYVAEIEDPIEGQYIDILLRDELQDEILPLEFVAWEELSHLKIENASVLNRQELLAYILWEITYWGFKGREKTEASKKLKAEENLNSQKIRKEWIEIKKDLGI